MNGRSTNVGASGGRLGAGRLPKLCGADIELGNFVLGLRSKRGTGFEASRLLLREIDGLPRVERFRGEPCDCPACRRARESSELGETIGRSSQGNGGAQGVVNPQDWGRKYLASNGGCAYIDLDHLKLCLPEVLSAYDHVACWHAMLRIARGALESANARSSRAGKRFRCWSTTATARATRTGAISTF